MTAHTTLHAIFNLRGHADANLPGHHLHPSFQIFIEVKILEIEVLSTRMTSFSFFFFFFFFFYLLYNVMLWSKRCIDHCPSPLLNMLKSSPPADHRPRPAHYRYNTPLLCLSRKEYNPPYPLRCLLSRVGFCFSGTHHLQRYPLRAQKERLSKLVLSFRVVEIK